MAVNFFSVQANAQGIFVEADGSPFVVGEGSPQAMVSADFNSDGHADLATLNFGAGVFVLLGGGDGGFAPTPGSPYSPGARPRDFAVGDFNCDGDPDIVVVGSSPPGNLHPHRVAVLLGDGQGGFAPPIETVLFISSIDGLISVAVGDFNGDNLPDLAITASIFYFDNPDVGFQNEVIILLGDCGGDWNTAVEVRIVDRVFSEPYIGMGATAHHTPQSIRAPDFNHDGNDDLVFVNPNTRDVSVWLSDPNANFTPAPGSPILPDHPLLVKIPHSVAVGDFDGDGEADLAVSTGSGFSIYVLLADGAGGFAPVQNSPFDVDTYASDLAVADFDYDGHLDLATDSVVRVSVLRGDGNGIFIVPAPGSPYDTGDGPGSLVAADFNGDGRVDLAVASQTSKDVTVLLQVVDTTPPNIMPAISGTLDSNGWYVSNVSLTWDVQDTESAITSTSGCGPRSVTSDTTAVTFTCTATSAGGTASESVTIKLDKTPPAGDCNAPDGLWHNADVAIGCTADGSISGLANAADAAFDLVTNVPAGTEDANAATNSHTVNDYAGNFYVAGPIAGNKVDKKAPDISINSPAAAVYLLNQAVASDYFCADGGSGLTSCAGPVASGQNVSTSVPGANSFTVNASDQVGNASNATNVYQVQYQPAGAMCNGAPGHQILDPIKADGSSVFRQKSTVPARFRVCDANGVSIGTPGVVSSFNLMQVISGTVTSDVNETVLSTTPDTAFRWDSTDQQWIFNISNQNLGANSTYVFRISLNDDTHIDFMYGLK